MRNKYDHEDIARKRETGWSWDAIAEELPGVTETQVMNAHRMWRKRNDLPRSADTVGHAPDRVTSGFVPSSGELNGQGRQPLSLDELMRLNDLRKEDWEVEWVRPGYSEVGAKDADGRVVVERLFNMKARLKPTVGYDALMEVREQVLEDIAERARRGKLRSRPHATEKPPSRPVLGEMVLMDVHLGLLAWRMEVGVDTDARIIEDFVRESVSSLVDEAAGRGISQWLLPVGNDFFHTDTTIQGKGGATTAGTPQDVDTRWQKAFGTGQRLMTWVIEHLLEIAPVDVLVVPGNHDETKAWFLGQVLDARFHDDPHVRIDNRPVLRKYHRWGNALLGFTHGSEEKPKRLPGLMTHEAPEAWGASRFREWHMGHFHHEHTIEDSGVRCRFLPPITGTEAWHHKKGLVGNQREAQLMLWTKDRGRCATFHHHIVPSPEQVEDLGPALDYVGTPRP